ncbi:MAG: hypothetical protein SGJ07_16820, partial [Rhodospirillaceae bacterium]|nr:hypothetical protein [Rhodospirillaceae bacterium]
MSRVSLRQDEETGRPEGGRTRALVLQPALRSASGEHMRSPEAKLDETVGLAAAIALDIAG